MRRHEGPTPKSSDLDENLTTNMLFCRDSNICPNFCTFWKTCGEKGAVFGTTTVDLWQNVHQYMVNIAYCTELNLQIVN